VITPMRRARGFSLVSAIFLMVVLVVLGVSMVTISSVQQTTTAQMLQVARANYAARAGAEWVARQALNPAWCAAGPYPMTITPFALPAPLSTFTIEVSCTRTTHTVDGVVKQYFVVDVTASSGNYNGPDYVRRKLRTKVFGS
jgi:MSHA biogenesis protein MshP